MPFVLPITVMCIPKRIKRPPRPPTAPSRRPRLPTSIDRIPSNLSSDSGWITSTEFSGISSSSSGSIRGIRDMLYECPIVYGVREVCRATEDLGSQKLGDSLWKSCLRNTVVAIARKSSCVGNFKEMLKIVGSVHHRSLVTLLGGCQEGGHVFIVYRYVEGSTLRELLRSSKFPGYSSLSTWKSRIQIAVDLAKALEYLHHQTIPGFVHKYVQSSNILVNDKCRVKIGYFGIAQLTGEVDTSFPERTAVTTVPVDSRCEIEDVSLGKEKVFRCSSTKFFGSQGYVAPEYVTSGIITSKYDVFGFGVVLLELLSGQEAMHNTDISWRLLRRASLPEMVQSILDDPNSKAKLRQWMDPVLRDSYPIEDAYKVASIARSCVDADPQKRPEMSHVALKLSKLLAAFERRESRLASAKSNTINSTAQVNH